MKPRIVFFEAHVQRERSSDLNCEVTSRPYEASLTKPAVNLERRSKRNFHFHSGSAPRSAYELKRPVQLEHALSHVDHA